MSGKQTMTWNGEADAKLLLAILKVSDVKPDFEAVAGQLTTETTTCTPRAVQEHLKKLRKLAQSDAADSSTTTTPSGKSTTATSSKKAASRKAAAGTPAGGVKKTRKPTGGKGKKGKSAAMVHDDDDAEDETVKTETRNDALDEGGLIGSELADRAQAEFVEEMSV